MKMKVLDFKQTSLNLTTMAVRIYPEDLTMNSHSPACLPLLNRQVMDQVEIDGKAIEQKAY